MIRRTWLLLSMFLSLGAALLITLTACSRNAPADGVDLIFKKPSGEKTEIFRMEVVATNSDRMRGLMFRKSLAANAGMIFLFNEEREQSFWMKNTLIPLDMVFVSSAWKVVGVLENVPPLTEDPRTVGIPSQYVLEFSAGTIKRLGVSNGVAVEVTGQLPPIQ